MTDIAECIPSSGAVHRGVFLCSLLAAPLFVGLGGTLFMALLLLVGSGGTLFGMLHLLSGLNVALLVVPLFVSMLSVPAYLILGVPAFWIIIKRFPETVERREVVPFVVAGLIANLGTYPLYFAGYPMFGGAVAVAEWLALLCFGFGIVLAPLYGLAFGALYCGLLPESGDRSAAHAAWENVLTNH